MPSRLGGFADLERRGAEVEDGRGSGGRQAPLPGLQSVERAGQKFPGPDVLADGDAEFSAPDGDGAHLGGGLEVPRLVEDVVGGSERLMRTTCGSFPASRTAAAL